MNGSAKRLRPDKFFADGNCSGVRTCASATARRSPLIAIVFAVALFTLQRDAAMISDALSGQPWAAIAPIHVSDLERWDDAEQWLSDAKRRGVSRVVFSPGEHQNKQPADAPVQSDTDTIEAAFHQWSGAGAERLAAGMRRLDALTSQTGLQPLLWPRLGTLISDIPGLLHVTRRMSRAQIVLEPLALFAGSTPAELQDLLVRFEDVIPLAPVAAICIDCSNQFHESSAAMATILRDFAKRLPPALPVILPADGFDDHRMRLSLTSTGRG